MSKLKRSSVFLIVVLGLLATSGIALAGHEDSHAEDTQFSFGYDETNHILSLNIGPNWEPYVCDFENGALTATYDDPDLDTGIIPILTLKKGADVKTFEARSVDDLLNKGDYAGPGTTSYAPDGSVCGLRGVVVAGPNGQFNHGQFMKAAKSLLNGLYEVKGHGCLVRHLAQSDIGKTGWTEPDITFFTFEADCERGKKKGDGDVESTRGGRPDSPGNSAKGHANKP